jgi:hypothetical protein
VAAAPSSEAVASEVGNSNAVVVAPSSESVVVVANRVVMTTVMLAVDAVAEGLDIGTTSLNATEMLQSKSRQTGPCWKKSNLLV